MKTKATAERIRTDEKKTFTMGELDMLMKKYVGKTILSELTKKSKLADAIRGPGEDEDSGTDSNVAFPSSYR